MVFSSLHQTKPFKRYFFLGCHGLTLIELIASVTIIGILAVGALPLTKVVVKRQKEIDLRRTLRKIRTAVDRFKEYTDAGMIKSEYGTEGYPPDLETLVQGVPQNNAIDKRIRFLRRIPIDPMNGTKDWGLRSSQDSWDATSTNGENIFDVYSKSNGIALDGSKYSEW